MNIKSIIIETLELLLQPQEIKALLTWPKFSLTSYRMLSALKRQDIKPNTIIDVGANVGQFAVASAKIFPNTSVHSFEPLPDCVALLQKNVKPLNNIKVYPFALGDAEAEVEFHVNEHSHSSSILPLAESHRKAFPNAQEKETISVKVSTLDDVFNSIELKSPILLKLDVQGYEAQTLRGGLKTLQRVDYVILEASFKPMYEGEMVFMDIVRLMEEYGFSFLRPVGWLSHPKTGEILQMDALFMKEK
jgi:FkbM family methyltransferase